MTFINRTRLVHFATGTFQAPALLDPPTVFRTSAVGQVAETVAEAMALVPLAQRPPESDWWQYTVQWEVVAHAVPTIKGVIPYTLQSLIVPLVVDVDFWQTEAQRLAGDPPIVRNTFTFGFNQRPRQYTDEVLRQVDEWLIRATFNHWLGDRRDLRQQVSLNAADDPRGLLATVASLDGVPRTLAGAWRP